MTTTSTTVFTIRHRKALMDVLTDGLTHAQLDQLTTTHPVTGDPGNGAGKTGRVELIVLTLMDEPDQTGLIEAMTMLDLPSLTGPAARSAQMLARRLAATGHPLPTPEPAAEAEPTPAPQKPKKGAKKGAKELSTAKKPKTKAQSPAVPEQSRRRRAAKRARLAARTHAPQQLVAIGGTTALATQLQSLEGIQVVHVEDEGTRAQALGVLEAVTTALQTPGALVAIGGPAEMIARLSLRP